MIRFFNEMTKRRALVCAVSAVFLLSAVIYLCSGCGRRRVFYFPRLSGNRVAVEARMLSSHPVQGKYALFVDELLLGPETERCRPLFSPGTKRVFCFVRGRTLYVGLSADVIYQTAPAAEIKRGVKLFKKNIKKNFIRISSVELFVDGKPVYENSKKS